MPTTPAPRALISGAASGIGLGICEYFAGHGARVLMLDIDSDAVIAAAEKIGESAVPLAGDVRDASTWQAAVGLAEELWGGLDVLVNDAGLDIVGGLLSYEEEAFDRVIGTNLKGTFLGLKFGAAAIAKSDGGAIVNISSIAGMKGSAPNAGPYCASKAGIIALTQTAAQEFRELGIRVNAICPGMIKTPQLDRNLARFEQESGEPLGEILAQRQGRMGQPADIAAAAWFLCSAEASLVSGAVLPVDGGVSAGTG